jgi:hypothetical protein
MMFKDDFCRQPLRRTLKSQIVMKSLITCLLLLIAINVHAQQAEPLEPDRKLTMTGTLWLIYGRGVINATKSAILEQDILDKRNGAPVLSTYVIRDEEGIASLKKWLEEYIRIVLNARYPDKEPATPTDRWRLKLYYTDEIGGESELLVIPLHRAFKNFTAEQFNSLVTQFRAVRQEEK